MFSVFPSVRPLSTTVANVSKQSATNSMICSVLGIKQVVIAINKMDLVDYRQDVFNRIFDDYRAFAKDLQFTEMTAIPM